MAVVALLVGCSADSAISTQRNGALEIQQHGAVGIEFSRSTDAQANPFEGTSQAVVKLSYQDCYRDFYADNPQWTFSAGELDLAAWNDALCDTDAIEGTLADCEVVSVQQDLDADLPSLTVRYEILGPFESRALLVGPLPNQEFVDCEGGFAPRVDVVLNGGHGLDALGDPLWSMLSVGVAQVAPGDSTTVRARAASE